MYIHFYAVVVTLLSAAAIGPTSFAQTTINFSGPTQAERCFEALSNSANVVSNELLDLCKQGANYPGLRRASKAAAINNRGIAHLRQGALAQAEVGFRAAIALSHAPQDVQLNLAAVLIRQGRHKDALAELDDPSRFSASNQPSAFYNRSIARLASDDVPGAYADLTTVLALNPNHEAAKRAISYFVVHTTE